MILKHEVSKKKNIFLYYVENPEMNTTLLQAEYLQKKIQTKRNCHAQGVLTNKTFGMAKRYHHRNVNFCAVSLAALLFQTTIIEDIFSAHRTNQQSHQYSVLLKCYAREVQVMHISRFVIVLLSASLRSLYSAKAEA